MKRCNVGVFTLTTLVYFALFFSTAQGQTANNQSTATQCYSGPTLSYTNTTGTSLPVVTFQTGGGANQIPAGHRIVDVLVQVVWSKSDLNSCTPATGLDANVSDVQSINPDIIYISLTGYGQSGPKSDWPGHDINFMAESGLLDLNRSEDGKPVIPAVQVADIVGGSYQLALQCMAAIIGNKKGAYLDISMVDGLVPLLALPMSQLVGGIDPHQFSMLSGGLVNYNVYQCADDRWIALGALELKFWNTFCDVAQQPSWKRTDIISLQVDQFDKRLVDDLFYSKTVDQWMALNEKKPFCLSPVLGIQELNS